MLGGDAGREVPITDGKLEKHLGPRLRKALDAMLEEYSKGSKF